MVKFCIEKYPKGSIPYQKTAGKYMDGFLYENIKVLAKKIPNDMTFLGILFSSTLEVGTGKSVLSQQIAEAYCEQLKELHGIEVPFNERNIVFKPEDLIERSFELPKYSVIILDEWEDAHYWSKLGMTLRQFFRKCRQLNLFMILIIPNFFQMTPGYAISRSVFAIDIKFKGEFERGFFSFYSFKRKKELYIKGKKTQDYNVVRPDFEGVFGDGYGIDEELYRKVKYRDMIEYEKKAEKNTDPRLLMISAIRKLYRISKDLTHQKIADAFKISPRTVCEWINEKEIPKEMDLSQQQGRDYVNTLDKKGHSSSSNKSEEESEKKEEEK